MFVCKNEQKIFMLGLLLNRYAQLFLLQSLAFTPCSLSVLGTYVGNGSEIYRMTIYSTYHDETLYWLIIGRGDKAEKLKWVRWYLYEMIRVTAEYLKIKGMTKLKKEK